MNILFQRTVSLLLKEFKMVIPHYKQLESPIDVLRQKLSFLLLTLLQLVF